MQLQNGQNNRYFSIKNVFNCDKHNRTNICLKVFKQLQIVVSGLFKETVLVPGVLDPPNKNF